MKYLAEEQKWKAFKILAPTFTIALLVVQIYGFVSTENCIAAQKSLMTELTTNVRYVVLSPYEKGNSLVNKNIIINNPATISKLITAYKRMRAQEAGDGGIPGQWQVMVTFVKKDGVEMNSYVFHNEFSDLIFTPTPQRSEYVGLGDFLSSREVAQILLTRLATK